MVVIVRAYSCNFFIMLNELQSEGLGHLTESTFDRKSNDVFHAKPNSNWFGCNNFFDAARRRVMSNINSMAPAGVEEIITTFYFRSNVFRSNVLSVKRLLVKCTFGLMSFGQSAFGQMTQTRNLSIVNMLLAFIFQEYFFKWPHQVHRQMDCANKYCKIYFNCVCN
jgi:hypothetical protein